MDRADIHQTRAFKPGQEAGVPDARFRRNGRKNADAVLDRMCADFKRV